MVRRNSKLRLDEIDSNITSIYENWRSTQANLDNAQTALHERAAEFRHEDSFLRDGVTQRLIGDVQRYENDIGRYTSDSKRLMGLREELVSSFAEARILQQERATQKELAKIRLDLLVEYKQTTPVLIDAIAKRRALDRSRGSYERVRKGARTERKVESKVEKSTMTLKEIYHRAHAKPIEEPEQATLEEEVLEDELEA